MSNPGNVGGSAPVSKILERLEASPDLAWAVDGDQRIRFMNRACEETLGAPSGGAIGKECFHVLRTLTSRGKAQCRPGCAAITAAKAGACPAMTLMRVRRPGTAEQWLTCSFTVLDGGESSLLMLHNASQVTQMVEAWSLLSNYASRMTGGRYASPVTPSRARGPNTNGGIAALSSREGEVLQCLGAGLSTRLIAHELAVSDETVRSNIKRVFAKLQVHSRVEAVAVLNAVGPR